MNKHAAQIGRGMLLMLFALGSNTAYAATGSFSATLEQKQTKPDAFAIGSIKWSCSGTLCRGNGASDDAVASCKALAQKVGPVKSFSAAGRTLSNCQDGSTAAKNSATPIVAKEKLTVAPLGNSKLATAKVMPAQTGGPKTITTTKLSYGLVR